MVKTVICQDVTGKGVEVPVADLQWRPSAYAFVVKDGKLLLSKQFDGYDLPGGGIELGETPEDAVIREIQEETGIVAKNPRLLAVATSYYKPISEDMYYEGLLLYYQCEYVGGELSMEGFDEEEKIYADMPEWFDLDSVHTIRCMSTNDYRQYLNLLEG